MKRREFIKFVGGGSCETVPTTLADIKNAIGCLEKNKFQPMEPMYVIAANKVGKTRGLASELFADSFIDDNIPGSLAVKRNQNYLKLRKSRF